MTSYNPMKVYKSNFPPSAIAYQTFYISKNVIDRITIVSRAVL